MFSSKICEVSLLICKEQDSSSGPLPGFPRLLPASRPTGVCRDLAASCKGMDPETAQSPGRGQAHRLSGPRPTQLLLTEPLVGFPTNT